MKKYELELFKKTRIGIDSGKRDLELELIRKKGIGINLKTRIRIGIDSKIRIRFGIDSKNTNWNCFRKHELELI
jgi:hypothetical protein